MPVAEPKQHAGAAAMEDSSGSSSADSSNSSSTSSCSNNREGGRAVAAAPKAAAAPRLAALDAERGIAAVHIVGFHYYRTVVPYFGSGSIWVPFFFMMSGFLLAYSDMSKPPSKRPTMSTLQYVRKRVAGIYPLYLLTLIMVLCNVPKRSAVAWGTLPLHVLLLQSVLPICVQHGDAWECVCYGYNDACWFMSVLLVYWFFIRQLTRQVERLSLRACYIALVACWLWSLVLALAHGRLPMPYTVWVDTALTAGPLGYLHVFSAGILCARVFVLAAMRDAATGASPARGFERLSLVAEEAPWILRYGCCIGYTLWVAFAVLYAKFLFDPTAVGHDRVYFFCLLGGVIPVMGLVLIGGAVGTDPLAKHVFQNQVFSVLGRVSFAMYILQLPVAIVLASYLAPESPGVQDRLPANPTVPAFLAIFPFVLLAVAWAAERYVERPYNEWQRWRTERGMPGADERLLARLAERRQERRALRLEAAKAGKHEEEGSSACGNDAAAAGSDAVATAV